MEAPFGAVILLVSLQFQSEGYVGGLSSFKTKQKETKKKPNKKEIIIIMIMMMMMMMMMMMIIDVACSFDARMEEKEQEKINHYQGLKIEVQKFWNCRSVFVHDPLIRALGAVSKRLNMWVSKTGTSGIITLLQKACLLGTAKILRRTLDT